MSVLNINSDIYREIKNHAQQHGIKIGNTAAFFIMLGIQFFENRSKSFEEIDTMTREYLRNKTVTN